MHCATPVICSNTSSLPELAGDAALRVDPLNVDAIASAMQRMAEDEILSSSFCEKGLVQARRFTWEGAAQAALEAFDHLEK
jgi:glycosyltransferase involved in cell wall biosynthesis